HRDREEACASMPIRRLASGPATISRDFSRMPLGRACGRLWRTISSKGMLRCSTRCLHRVIRGPVGALVAPQVPPKADEIAAPPKSSGSLDDALVQCVKDVRHALSDETHRLIKTVPRRGYLFTLEPTRDSSTSYAPTRSDQHIEFCRAKDGVKLAMASIGQGLPLVRLPTWFNHLEYDWHVQFRSALYRFLADRWVTK